MNHLSQEQIYGFIENAISKEEVLSMQAHLKGCEACQQEVEIARLLTSDLKVMEVPEVPPGFALRVSQQINARELESVFSKPVFRIFKGALLLSLVVAVVTVIYQLADLRIILPELEVASWGYYILVMTCLSIVFVIDKVLSSRIKQ